MVPAFLAIVSKSPLAILAPKSSSAVLMISLGKILRCVITRQKHVYIWGDFKLLSNRFLEGLQPTSTTTRSEKWEECLLVFLAGISLINRVLQPFFPSVVCCVLGSYIEICMQFFLLISILLLCHSQRTVLPSLLVFHFVCNWFWCTKIVHLYVDLHIDVFFGDFSD